MSPQATVAPSLHNPFRGLRPFEADEADLFFGRKVETGAVLERLHRHRFLAVVGASGCGKSSLVRAGAIASLRVGASADEPTWRIAIMRPGNRPISSLAAALRAPDALGAGPAGDLGPGTALRRGGLGIIESFRQSALPDASRLFILVDQFEELFRFVSESPGQATEEAIAFVTLLLEACAQREFEIYVALTMRSEYLGLCDMFPGLPDAINEGMYLVPRMSRDQVRETIEEPIRASGGDIAERLVDRLLNDLGLLERPLPSPAEERRPVAARRQNLAERAPDQLPVLQHALTCLWNEWIGEAPRRPRIDVEHYGRIGVLGVSLSKHADACLHDVEARVPHGRRTAEVLFRCLTEITADGRRIRRPARLGDIARVAETSVEDIATVVEVFRAEGRSFLMPPPSERLGPDSVVDISHESLIRQWHTLREWVQAEARMADVYRRLAEAAARWSARGRHRADLWRGGQLDEALQWQKTTRPTTAWAERYGGDFEVATQFLQRSRTSEWYRRKVFVPVLGLAAVVLAGALVYASWGAFTTLTDTGTMLRVQSEGRQLVQSARVDQGDLGLWVKAQLLWDRPEAAEDALTTLNRTAAVSVLQQLAGESLGAPRSPGEARVSPQKALDLAQRVVATIEDPAERNQARARLVPMFVRAGLVPAAREVTDRIDEPEVRARALVESAQLSGPDALALAESASQAARTIASPGRRAAVLVAVAEVMNRLGAAERARELAEDAYKNATATDAEGSGVPLDVPVVALVNAGRLEAAEAAARAIPSVVVRGEALTRIAREHARAGRRNEALRIVSALEEYRRDSALIAIATELVSTGRFDDALAVADGISPSTKDRALLGLAVAMARAGRVAEARRATADINDRAVRGMANLEILRADAVRRPTAIPPDVIGKAMAEASAVGDPTLRDLLTFDLFQDLLESGRLPEARTVAGALGDATRRSRALLRIASAQYRAGQQQLAATTVTEASQAIEKLPDEVRPVALTGLSEAQASVGLFRRARETAVSITDTRLRGQALGVVAQAMATSGHGREAYALVREIPDRSERLGAHARILIGWKQASGGATERPTARGSP